MGAGSSSSFSSLGTNELLKKFVSSEVITYNDPYWNTLLSFSSRVPRNSGDSRLLDESVQPLLTELVRNTTVSGNLATLVKVFLAHADQLEESTQCQNDVFVWQTHNALFIIRVITKLLLEHHTEDRAIELLQHTGSPGSSEPRSLPESSPLLRQLLSATVTVLVTLKLSPATHSVLLEATTLLTVALSSHVCVRGQPTHFIYGLLETVCANRSAGLVTTLLRHIMTRPAPPPPEDSGTSFVAGLAAGLWSVLTLGLSADSAAVTDGQTHAAGSSAIPVPDKPVPPSPLADHSLLLLLALTTHPSTLPPPAGIGPAQHDNVFRTALFSAVNDSSNKSSSTLPPTSSHTIRDNTVAVCYSELLEALCATLHTEHSTLLLYLLLHNNEPFRQYILSVSSLESVVLPLLQCLHCAVHLSSHHVYMALIVLLILTEDSGFSSALHDIGLPSVPWYTERPLTNVTLGDMLILVLIRTITYNITKMRDRYLHSNCLAALANLSSRVRRLHGYVCQRLVALLETLARRQMRVLAAIRENTHSGEDLLSDLSVLEEVLRMVLEILNSSLTHQLQHNPQLLYTLLYKRNVFEPFSSQPNFSDICSNIDTVLDFLMTRLEKTTQDPSVQDVQRVIEEGVLQLPKERLRKFPELKFKYVEESSPEEFFTPYVWTLIYHSSGLYWPADSVALFDPSGQES